MKLHLNTVESTSGLIFKTKIWLMDARLELTNAEATIVKAHRDIGKMVVGEADLTANPNLPGEPEKITVNKLVTGITSYRFWSIQNQTNSEVSIREGCKALKGHLGRLVEVGTSGPTVEEI
ncbi:MAG: hypothetical protein JWR07_742 [Nevskia sp.]|nr:hypothetical protein [Nevskia sp.]